MVIVMVTSWDVIVVEEQQRIPTKVVTCINSRWASL